MSACELCQTPDIELFFYGELDAADRARVDVHLRKCAPCRQRLDDLHAIRRALADRPAVDAPPTGDWSGFMRRLDVAIQPARSLELLATREPAHVRERDQPARSNRRLASRHAIALAAMVALVVTGVFMAARFGAVNRSDRGVQPTPNTVAQRSPDAPQVADDAATADERALRAVSAEHLERSKLVVLGLATRDPQATKSADWQYERELAGTLLSDTRLYRLTAQDRGISDVARVMRDLETVLLETSLSEDADRNALERVQRLIAKRDLVLKMQVVATTGSAGI
jgi:hypothetical protein